MVKIIGVLQCDYNNSNVEVANYDCTRSIEPWVPEGYELKFISLRKSNVVSELNKLAQTVDVFLNLCEGGWYQDVPGIDVVETLEKLKVPFTGASSGFYDPSKEMMKKIFLENNIITAPYVVAYNENDIQTAIKNLKFPMFLKHYHSGNSYGISKNSKVHDVKELLNEAKLMMTQFGGVLIEEFIEGREFSVFIASNPNDPNNPIVYDPVEAHFYELDESGKLIDFKTFNYKWVRDNIHGKCNLKPEIVKQMQEQTKTTFLALGGSGYARTDIRMDKDENVYFLEINPNCCIFYGSASTADSILLLDEKNGGTKKFMEQQIAFAYKRCKSITDQ